MVAYSYRMMFRGPCSLCSKEMVRLMQPGVKLHFCGMPCKAEWQRRQRPVTVEWLRQKYVDEGFNTTQIAAMVGRDPKSVWFWLKGSGIQTRPRGGFTAPARFVKGRPSLFLGRKHTPETRQKLRDISLADGRVPFLKNGVHHLLGHRGEGHPNWKGGHTPERQAFYASDAWKLACKAVWSRCRGACDRCGVRQVDETRGLFHIHHIIPFADVTLRAEPTNLAFLCIECHHFVHSKKNVNHEFIRES